MDNSVPCEYKSMETKDLVANCFYCIIKQVKITSFVLYFYTIFQAVSFLTNVDRRCPLLGILLHV
ncbi:hypothetical protein Hanom_Chr11g00997201 [Helianthus anomalus]